MYDVNVLGLVRVTQALLPALRASGDAVVVNVGSTAGRWAYEGGGGYTAAKHGVKVVSETLRLELNGEPIRISEVAPGMVRTDEFSLKRFGGDQDEGRRGVRRGRPAAARRGRRRRDRLGRDPALPRRHRRAGHQAACPSSGTQGAPVLRGGRLPRVKTIGLVGGMSWESSAVYYRDLNLGMRERLGGLSSPKLALTTVDFAEVTHLEDDERWDQVGALLADAARGVERAGADFLLLCTTTFHKVADQVEEAVDIPLLHLGDVVADGRQGRRRGDGRPHRHQGRDVGVVLRRPARRSTACR